MNIIESRLTTSKSSEPFYINDITGALKQLSKSATVFRLLWDRSVVGNEDIIKDFISKVNMDNSIICCCTFISTAEFPSDKYFDPIIEKTINGKLPLPIDEILTRERKVLESLGFININKYVGYEYGEAFVYGNTLGKEVSDYLLKE